MIALNIAGRRERVDSLVTPAVAGGGGVRENSASVHMCLVLQQCVRNRHSPSYHADVCQRHTDDESRPMNCLRIMTGLTCGIQSLRTLIGPVLWLRLLLNIWRGGVSGLLQARPPPTISA